MKLPKWHNPERYNALLDMWERLGNRCLRGHYLCDDKSHYVTITPEVITTSVRWYKDKSGNVVWDNYTQVVKDKDNHILYNPDGTPQTITLYPDKRYIVPRYERVDSPYDKLSREVVADWVKDDQSKRAYERKLAQRELHFLPSRGRLRGMFGAISREIYHDNQPLWYFENIGFSVVKSSPFAVVRIASSFTRLHIDIGAELRKVSKNRKRKFTRYGKALPIPVQLAVEKTVNKAIKSYLAH